MRETVEYPGGVGVSGLSSGIKASRSQSREEAYFKNDGSLLSDEISSDNDEEPLQKKN